MEILTAIIPTIIEYTIKPVSRQVGYLIHYKSNLENLRSQLKNLNLAKERMKHTVKEGERKGKQVHTDVQDWQKVADEMIEEAQTIFENEGRANTKCFRGVCLNLVSYHHFSMKSAKLAKRIEPHEKVQFPSVFRDVPQEEIFDTPSEDYMPFESRISKVKEIMEELRNPDTNLIGVYGLGGVGKSTLAKAVYRQARKEKLFDDVVVVLDVKQYSGLERNEKIRMKIAASLVMNVEKTQGMHIWNRIKDKKSLIILDDIWEAIDLEVLGLRPMATCKILFTSRVRVFEMRAQKEFSLDVLGEKESWSLFEKMAGDVVKDDPIKKIATQISKKCGGLPVLVVAVASALRLNSSLEVWKDTLRRFKRFDGKELTEKARLAIEWSYNRLNAEELQPLFLLCGIIAEGSTSIYLFYLLHCAMGLGLITNVDTLEEARNALHSLAKKLKDSCLLLDGNEDGTVRMHELVRDVAIWIASRDRHAFSRVHGDELKEWPNSDFLKKCSAISLKYCKIPRLPEEPWVCPELRFFVLESDKIDDSLEIPGNFFEGMNELKVLDVTRLRIPSLPPTLQSLTNLQTLCLDKCELGDIALVGQLTNLKILSLLHSKVKELPKEIGQLTRLQLLDLNYCSELIRISPGVISSLTSLEDLRMGIHSFKKWEGGLIDGSSNASVSELKQLRQLTALDIHIPDAKLLPANMFSDTRLERYTILVGDWFQYPYPFYRTSSNNMVKLKLTTNSQFDQGIKLLLERCEELYLDGVVAANIISYILESDSGKQLKNLHFQNNDEVTAVIKSGHAFPNLESLSLENLVNLGTVCCGQLIAQPFQKLRYLTLRNLPKLIGLSSKGSTSVVTTEAEEIISENEIGGPTKLFMNGEVLMPNLTCLILHQCDDLRFLFSYSMARSLVQLEQLVISKCQMMEEIVSTSGYNQEHTDNMFCHLKYLTLQHLPSLTRFCFGSYIEFSLLETLRIEDCPRLGTFIFDRKSEITSMGKENDDRNSKENLETVIPHFLFDEKVGFPSLESLIIDDMSKLTTIWHNRLAPNSFCKLKKVEVLRCKTLINIFAPSMMGRLSALDTLKIRGFTSLQAVFEQTYDTSTPKLFMNGEVLMPNLTSLVVDDCGGLRFLFSSSMARSLAQLKKLEISRCQIMEEIVSRNESSEEDTDQNMFSQLQNLELRCLPNLTRFCSARRSINFHSLEKLRLELCSKLETFIFDPMSTNITINKAIEEIRDSTENIGTDARYFLFDEKVLMPNLTSLVVSGCGGLRFLFPSSMARSLAQLKKLKISNCRIMEEIVSTNESSEEDTDHNMFSQLQDLSLQYLRNLTRFCSARRSINFHSLEILHLEDCSKLETFIFDPMSTNITINKATEEIRDSTENIGNDARYFLFDEKVGFPSLERLIIRGLPVLRTIWHNRLAPNSFCKLKKVEVLRCNTLINIFAPSMMGRLNALDTLKIQECKSLQAVFEQTYDTSTTKLFMNGEGNPFPSLETLYLEIWYEAHDPLPAELFINLKAIQFSCAQPPPFHFLQKLHNLEKLHVCGGPWKEIFVYEGTSSGEIDAVGTTLPHIKNLSLTKMEELMHLGNDNSELIFPNLEILNVCNCGRLKNLTSSTISFHNLTTLQVFGCMGLKYLVTYSVAKCLHQLKTLRVWYCESITEIVAINGDEEDSGNNYEITFRSLQHLELLNLPSLRGFCSSGNCTVRVPSLLSVYSRRIELKISPDGSLIQSGSRPERQQITEEVVEEEDDVNETEGKQLIAHTN